MGLIVVSFLFREVNAQNKMSDCIKNTFMHMDSIDKPGTNPFEVWKTCVLEKPMPDFVCTSMNGDIIQLSKLKGKIVVINFWFIDCHPCIAELPGLNKIVKDYKANEVVFLAITWETSQRLSKDFFPERTLDFIIIPDARLVIDKVAGSGYPTTYVIDRNGIIKEVWNGGSIDEKAGAEFYEKAKPAIDKLLKAE